MVRPSENWERLVRATLRREKLRHDGRGGHERAPIGIAGSMPPSLTRETNIDLILPAANEIQSEDPNVARIRLVSLEILQLCHPKRLGFLHLSPAARLHSIQLNFGLPAFIGTHLSQFSLPSLSLSYTFTCKISFLGLQATRRLGSGNRNEETAPKLVRSIQSAP